MKRILNISYEKIINVLLITGAMLLTACQMGQDTQESRISVDKDGKVTSYITESFDQDHYDIEELQQMILSEAASYNRSMGGGNITAEKIEAKEQKAEVVMNYASSVDYSAFNNVVFFVGSPIAAAKEGYDLNVVLSSVDDKNATIGEADILAIEDMWLLITDAPEAVELSGKAVYADDHAALSENKKVLLSAEREAPVYVLFKP